MSPPSTTHKLMFPGMLDKRYQQYREKLIQARDADKTKPKRAKTLAFKAVADGILPGWDHQ